MYCCGRRYRASSCEPSPLREPGFTTFRRKSHAVIMWTRFANKSPRQQAGRQARVAQCRTFAEGQIRSVPSTLGRLRSSFVARCGKWYPIPPSQPSCAQPGRSIPSPAGDVAEGAEHRTTINSLILANAPRFWVTAILGRRKRRQCRTPRARRNGRMTTRCGGTAKPKNSQRDGSKLAHASVFRANDGLIGKTGCEW